MLLLLTGYWMKLFVQSDSPCTEIHIMQSLLIIFLLLLINFRWCLNELIKILRHQTDSLDYQIEVNYW